MKKWLCSFLLFVGCGPLAVDFTVGWGSNQTIDKTLKMNQKQTKAQTESAAEVVADIIEMIPSLARSATPAPTPPIVQSVTVQLVPTPVPTPIVTESTIETYEYRRTPVLPKARTARKKATPTPTPSLKLCPDLFGCSAANHQYQSCVYRGAENAVYCQ